LSELIIKIETIDPVEIFGINNQKVNHLKKHFPKLKLIARGDVLKVVGEENLLDEFEDRFKQMIEHYNRYQRLSATDIDGILSGEKQHETAKHSDVIVYGQNGIVVKAKTPNQRKMVELITKNDMLFAIGPAGTGKTYTAIALAVKALKDKEVKKIILSRPAVEAGENLGFLPGDLKEKLDPYLQPLYDALYDMIPLDKLKSMIESRTIEIAPLAFMRGRTLNNAFVILDEAQNSTENQIKMFLTRMGGNAKFIITGDITQVDLPRNQPSGLIQASKILKGIKGIAIVYLDAKDVIRHKLVKDITAAYEKMKK
jgi:phosphate starvation-inducible protein PhoH and related proteins